MQTPDDAQQALDSLEKIARAAPVETLPTLLGDLEALQAIVLARLIASSASTAPVAVDERDRLLSAEQAQARYFPGLTLRQFKRRKWSFRVKEGHKTPLYSDRAIQRYLSKKHA